MSESDQNNKFWAKYFPYLFVCSALIGGYIVAFKFIQLGIPDLGERVLNIPKKAVHLNIALMAIITCLSAVVSGVFFDKHKYTFKRKIQFLIGGGIIQGGILVGIFIMSEPIHFTLWIIAFSAVLGFLFPLTYSLMYFLIPAKHRGYVAGIITGVAYLIGALSPFDWTIEDLSIEAMIVMSPSILLMGLMLLKKDIFSLYEINDENREDYVGRFTKDKETYHSFIYIVILMFGVYFVDSFGFLRVINEDMIIDVTWHGDIYIKLLIGFTHLFSALIMGVIYQKYNEKIVFLCALIGFVIGDFLFSLYPTGILLYITASIYCATVSFYTINSFMAWSDISTENNISKHAGIGVGIGGWLSSFLSTTITTFLFETLTGTSGFARHLQISGVIAVLFLVFSILYLKKSRKKT
ncbi:MAG: hypothetical protein GF364_06450 [Candidatus Lokiarchaeota archaeon]|nr:hypothetical protein [Candidatus Lokiarchaeota archaeon]